jgi:hypothetical protein
MSARANNSAGMAWVLKLMMLIIVAGTILGTVGCDGGHVYVGVSVPGPYVGHPGYPYGGGFGGVGVMYGRPMYYP